MSKKKRFSLLAEHQALHTFIIGIRNKPFVKMGKDAPYDLECGICGHAGNLKDGYPDPDFRHYKGCLKVKAEKFLDKVGKERRRLMANDPTAP